MGNAEVTAIRRTRLNLLLNALRQKVAFTLGDYTEAEEAKQLKQTGAVINTETIDARLKTSQAKAAEAAGATIAGAHVLGSLDQGETLASRDVSPRGRPAPPC